MTKKTERHRRHGDFESFDRIELDLVPRYKTSGMSGDEWRTSVRIRFWFKGEIVYEDRAVAMRYALMLLPAKWLAAQEPIPDRVIELEDLGKCDQPGCSNDSVSRYRFKRVFSAHGEALDESEQSFWEYYAQFCKQHLRRGDCGREDSDANYEVVSGPGPDDSTNVIESPSGTVVVHVDSPDEIPATLKALRKER